MEYWVKNGDPPVDGHYEIYCQISSEEQYLVGGVNAADLQRAQLYRLRPDSFDADFLPWVRVRVRIEDFGGFKRFLEVRMPFAYWNTNSNNGWIVFDVCYTSSY